MYVCILKYTINCFAAIYCSLLITDYHINAHKLPYLLCLSKQPNSHFAQLSTTYLPLNAADANTIYIYKPSTCLEKLVRVLVFFLGWSVLRKDRLLATLQECIRSCFISAPESRLTSQKSQNHRTFTWFRCDDPRFPCLFHLLLQAVHVTIHNGIDQITLGGLILKNTTHHVISQYRVIDVQACACYLDDTQTRFHQIGIWLQNVQHCGMFRKLSITTKNREKKPE